MKILLVEDEKQLSDIIAKGLKKCGYVVDAAYDGEEALYCYEVNQYDLILLDINLPKCSGLQVLEQIREKDAFSKILILSAKSDVDDKVKGLDLGANDYLAKPFDFLELAARIRNLLRMNFVKEEAEQVCGNLVLDGITGQFYLNGQLLPLTSKEFSILEYLMVNKEKVVSAETLLEHGWDSEADLFSNSLKYHIHSIKKKLREQGLQGASLTNKRGRGYLLTERENEDA